MLISDVVKADEATILDMTNKLSGQYTFRIPVELENELERIAQVERRKRSDIARFLVERGLAAYKRDNGLFEPPPAPKERPASDAGDLGEVRRRKA